MKYYYNKKKDIILIDPNDNTPYLEKKGYKEVSEEFYKKKEKELSDKMIEEEE